MNMHQPHRRSFRRGRLSPPSLACVADAQDIDKVFGALAHDVRRGILAVLHDWGGPMRAGDIALRFEGVCSWQAVSRHLGVLTEAGLLECRPIRNGRLYSVNAHPLQTVAMRWIMVVSEPIVWREPWMLDWADLGFGFEIDE